MAKVRLMPQTPVKQIRCGFTQISDVGKGPTFGSLRSDLRVSQVRGEATSGPG